MSARTGRPYSDEYRQLIEQAHDAIRDLLDGSTHDSWLDLRMSYGSLRTALTKDDEQRLRTEERPPVSAPDDVPEHVHERRELRERWTYLPADRREALVLDVLGDRKLTVAEVTEGLKSRLGVSGFYESAARPLITKMLRTGQLERVPEQFYGKTRYRYMRRTLLDGPIADLERIYHDHDGAA